MSDTTVMAPGLYFATLGCAKNEVDTDHMIRRVSAAGYRIVDSPEQAQGIIVNTCSFIRAATEESLDTIFEFAGSDSVIAGETKIIVCGCMPSRYGDALEQELSEVETFIPCKKEDDIVTVLDDVFKIDRSSGVISGLTHGSENYIQGSSEVSAYVKISDGCDRFCTYCTIPFIRGSYHSFSAEAIVSEVEGLTCNGVKEIVLIAQDTGRWGEDFTEQKTLAQLLTLLAEKFPRTWFRVMYLQPEGITDELLDVIKKYDTICSYFDIPLQHCDADILSSMNRTGSKHDFMQMIDHIRSVIPKAIIRTTLIAGFPGETQEAFDSLCDFVAEANFDYVGVFPYSQEEGTKAANLSDQIDEEEKLERAQVIRDLGDAVGLQKAASRVGRFVEVLIEGREEDGQLFGRTQGQAPEVDGVVYVSRGEIGDRVIVEVTDSFLYDLEA